MHIRGGNDPILQDLHTGCDHFIIAGIAVEHGEACSFRISVSFVDIIIIQIGRMLKEQIIVRDADRL